MSEWREEARRRFLRSRPPPDGLRAMARAVAPGSKVVAVKRLKGGLGSSTHRVTLQRRSGRTLHVVLKRTDSFDGGATKEFERLAFAATLPVPSAKPVALDADGAWFGFPAHVQGFLPGRPELRFADPLPHYAQIAEAILANASVPLSTMPRSLRLPRFEFKVRDRMRGNPLVERAIEVVERELPVISKPRLVITHGDLHPGNMLWSRGKLTGLVDWACYNHYLEREVVYCRTELAVLFGLREADRFLDTFERVAGRRTEHMPVWDLMQGVTAMTWGAGWAHAYREQGRTDLTDGIALRRAHRVVERALAATGSS